MSEKSSIEFVPGSKIVFVAGGYEGGQETKGIVLSTYEDKWGPFVRVAIYEVHCEEVHYIEDFPQGTLEKDILQGRVEGSCKCTLLTQPSSCPPGA